MSINPSEAQFFDELEAAQAQPGAKPLSELSLAEYRAMAALFAGNAGEPAAVSFKEITIAARDGYEVPVRVYHDDLSESTPVLIFFPGCGYQIDLFEVNAIAASRIADYSGMKVMVVNHRLAPEHPMPGSMQDGYDVTQYVATHADEFAVDPQKIMLGGFSSGGNCAAVISCLARKTDSFSIHQQILINAWLDLGRTTPGFKDVEKEDRMITEEGVEFLISNLNLTEADFSNPLINPIIESDLSGLPKTVVVVSEHDGIRADSEGYFKRLVEAGVEAEKIILPGQSHNTLLMRKVLSDGKDPAEVIAKAMKKNI